MELSQLYYFIQFYSRNIFFRGILYEWGWTMKHKKIPFIALVLMSILLSCACSNQQRSLDSGESVLSGASAASSAQSVNPDSSPSFASSVAQSSWTSVSSAAPSSKESHPPSSAPDLSVKIPQWYTPGKLSVTAICSGNVSPVSGKARPQVLPLSVTKLSQQSIVLPSGCEVAGGGVDADYIPLAASPLYPGGIGIYFHIPTRQVICFSDKAGAALRAKNLIPPGGLFYLQLEDAVSGFCILDVRDREYLEAGYYLYNIYDGRFWSLKSIPLSFPFVGLSPDKKFLTTIVDIPSDSSELMVQDLCLLDLTASTLKTTMVTRQALPYILSSGFSDTGKYLYYRTGMLQSGQVYYPTYELYNIKTKGKIAFQGNIIRFADNDKLIIVEPPSGAVVLDSDTGRDVTATAKLKDWQNYRVDIDGGETKEREHPPTGPFIPNYKVTLTPLFPGWTAKTVLSGADAVCVLDEYLYSYRDGDTYVTCTQMMTGQSFNLPLDDAFIHSVASVNRAYTALLFHMYISPDKTRLTLFYSTDKAFY